MNAYAVGEQFSSSAMLVFANTAREARKISYGKYWHEPTERDDWLYWEAERLRGLPEHLLSLDTGIPQVIPSPPTCERCGMWGGVPSVSGCSRCEEEDGA